MAKKPCQDTRLAKFVEARLLELKHTKTQTEVAEAAGFLNPNMLTMIKKGSTKLPVDRVPALAAAGTVTVPCCCAWLWSRARAAR